jgi:hypothetical protein
MTNVQTIQAQLGGVVLLAAPFFVPAARSNAPRQGVNVYERHNKHVCFVMDPDAETLLRAMVPQGRGIGLFLSELVRKEAREREGRPALVKALRDESQAGQV